MKAITYSRVSTVEQSANGYGLPAQQERMAQECARRGWESIPIEDSASGKNTNRPGLTYALSLLARGEADALMASKLDRLSRSVADFAQLMATAKAQGWILVILDLGIDTTTPHGKMIASIMASLAEWERDMISLRTKEGLAQAKADGVVLGSPRIESEPATLALIAKLKEEGKSLREIAADLTAAGIATKRGSSVWHPNTIVRILKSAA